MKVLACAIGLTLLAIAAPATQQPAFHPDIPKAWDDKEVESMEVPLAQRDRSPRYMTSAEYYALKVRPIYRSYPVYDKGREPAGYLESLKQKDPEIIFDPAKLHTKEDWIAAGKLVFESDTFFFPPPQQPAVSPWPTSPEGIVPYYHPGNRYYVRQKGVVEVGSNSCAGCHTRPMPDGSFFEGGQGIPDPPVSPATINAIRDSTPEVFQTRVDRAWVHFGAPWVMSKEEFEKSFTKEAIISELQARRPSVFARQGTSLSHPVRIPSLVGIQDIKYLDATGLVRHRSIGDIMRYAIINEGLDTLAHYGDFQPSPGTTAFSGEARHPLQRRAALRPRPLHLLPQTSTQPQPLRRSGPPRPANLPGAGLPRMPHPAPLHQQQAQPPQKASKSPTISARPTTSCPSPSAPTQPSPCRLAAEPASTKSPHSAASGTAPAWATPARPKPSKSGSTQPASRDDYVPKGFHLGPGPIEGHEKGLTLSPEDRKALIAFLKTL